MEEFQTPGSMKRQVAVKVRISDVTNGQFVKGSENKPSHVIIPSKEKVGRVNIICAVISKQTEEGPHSIIVDDGSGSLTARTFDNPQIFEKINIGDIVLLIGRVREFNGEKYIIPEIVSKKDSGWLKYRKVELGKRLEVEVEEKEAEVTEEKVEAVKEAVTDDNPVEQVSKLIKKLDSGDGVDIEEVISNSSHKNTEELIQKLMQSGDVFEVKPGRVKVLE